jgi:hypothetical protein
MRWLVFGLIGLSFLASCTINQPRRTPAEGDDELFYHPQLVVDKEVPLERLTLWGVKLGDPATAIPRGRIREHARQGWLWCDRGTRYRIDQGTVVTLGIWDPTLLESFHIHSPADIEARFGPTQDIDIANPIRVYRYRDGKLAVIWTDRERQLNAINISQ